MKAAFDETSNEASDQAFDKPSSQTPNQASSQVSSQVSLEEKETWRREHTNMPDLTFPLNAFHIAESDPNMFCIPPHWHEHLEWIVVTSGRFSVQVGAALRELTAGDCAFVNTGQLHAAFPLEPGSRLHALVFGEVLLRNHALDHTEARYIRPLLEGRLGLQSFYEKEASADIRPYLLREGGRTVQEIARRVGYGDAGYFARVFRKFKGVSPGRYAEMNRGLKSDY